MSEGSGTQEFEVGRLLRALDKAVRRWHRGVELGELFPEAQRGHSALVEQQMLYEKWLKRPAWNLRREAVPLLVGADPDAWPDALAAAAVADAERALWQAVADGGGPALKEAVAEPAEWSVEPAAVWNWARACGHAPPAAFDALMQFILRVMPVPSTARPAVAVPLPGGWSSVELPPLGTAREQVLGAALAIVARWPEQCRDGNGFIDGGRIVERMRQQAAAWFDTPELPLPATEAVALIERWLR